ncbi:unnamed protein product [Parascedosporium putredinis]|uniref:Major facilitator superfamily (MFS) profile domain-containing protein n=1 Tax=Parascedosporium putredinis TaxID=1442378 RepID=A0A9P1M7M2_9PEZI|nr:unnamed protein product [Parascedosporium putredinis]CAI7990745.1 unnamed protein product [Parascedosporium putredinis]
MYSIAERAASDRTLGAAPDMDRRSDRDSDSTGLEKPQYAPVTAAPTGHDNGPHRRSHSFSSSRSRAKSASGSRRESVDPDLDINLPYRTLSNNADMTEYRTETEAGAIEGPVIPPAEGRRRAALSADDVYAGDPENPKNWSKARKWYCTMVVAVTCFVVTFASSNVSADMTGVMEEFDYASIPIPKPSLLTVIFIIPCAVAQNIETLLICRFIGGVMFSAPMTLVGGTLADMWRNEERGVPMSAFSAAPFMGPAFGPLIGGFLADATNWRWLYWIQIIVAGIMWILITFTVPETYTPTILARRARKLRKATGKSYVTEHDLDMRPLRERLAIFLVRPFQLLFTELIVFLFSLYMSILYGVLYMFFVAFPIIYQKGKGYSASKTGLMFIPLAVGVLASGLCAPLVNKHYVSIGKSKYGGRPPAEARLYPMMASCWLMPLGLFIFAWTSYPRLSWAGPALGGLPIGFGFIFMYNATNNYLVDCYQHQAASALAAKVCLRAFWGAGVILFTVQMYDRLGYQWASSLVAFISLACCAIPFAFFRYGAKIREWSKYAYAGDDEDVIGAGPSDIENGKEKKVDGSGGGGITEPR